jgi:hypothetical protein
MPAYQGILQSADEDGGTDANTAPLPYACLPAAAGVPSPCSSLTVEEPEGAEPSVAVPLQVVQEGAVHVTAWPRLPTWTTSLPLKYRYKSFPSKRYKSMLCSYLVICSIVMSVGNPCCPHLFIQIGIVCMLCNSFLLPCLGLFVGYLLIGFFYSALPCNWLLRRLGHASFQNRLNRARWSPQNTRIFCQIYCD